MSAKGFFKFDGPFQTFLGKLIDVILVSIFWFVFCIPIVTAGASTTALYDTVRRVLDEDRGYLWRTFWHSFKSNFKVSTPAWLVELLLFLILFIDQRIMAASASRGSVFSVLFYINWIFIILLIIWMDYTFAYIARFVDTSMNSVRNGILLLLSNLGWSVLMALILIGAVALVYAIGLNPFTPVLVILLPPIVTWLNVKIIEHVFKRIMPKDDENTETE